MSINVSVHRSPVSIRRGKMLITDIENLKKTEINRRRRLRLEQVRQQSKDIAHHIRQKVRNEQGQQGSAFERHQSAELRRLQARKLLLLQQCYQDCLDEVGMGHRQAALQPEPAAVLEAERKRNWTQAQDRGREATAKLRLQLADMAQKKNAPRKQQNFVRAVEDLRSVVVTSLQKSPKQTPQKRHHHLQQQQEQPLGIAHSPHCTCGCEVCTCTPQIVTAGAQETPSPSEPESQQVHKQEDTTALSLDTYDDVSERSSSTESRLQSHPTSSTTTRSMKEVKKSRVQFYDHGNRFEGDYRHQIRVERMFPHANELDATQAAEVESQNFAASKFLLDDNTSKMLHDRGQQALVRERLYKDYRLLLDDLHGLAREERLIRSTWPHSLPTEIFQEDYRRKELCGERQKNMDSAFESVYHSAQQHLVSRPSSIAESHSSNPWEGKAQDSPARLNVANCQTLSGPRQKPASPVNTVNVAATTTNTHITTGAVCSAKKVLTLEDLVKQINSQYTLLMDEMTMHGSVPQEPLGNAISSPKKDNMVMAGNTDQSSADKRSSEVKSSLLEVHDDVSHEEGPSLLEVHDDVSHEEGPSLLEVHDDVSHEEGPSLLEVHDDVSHEEGPSLLEVHDDVSCEEEYTRHEQKVMKTVEGLKNDKVLLGGRRNNGDHKIHEEGTINLPMEYENPRDLEGNRESGALNVRTGGKRCRKHQKKKVENKVVKEQNLVSEIDSTDRGEIEIMRKDDSISVLSEYSFDISVSKTKEHSVELSSETSSSTSYEGVKVVVSVSELTQKKYQSTSPRKGAVISHGNSPQATEKHRILDSKTGKWKHKRHASTCSRSVKEKATMTAEDVIDMSGKGNLKTDLMIERSESKTRQDKDKTLDKTKQWQDVICSNAVTDKALSEGSTSYMSLPDQLVASNIQHLEQLLTAWHNYQTAGGSEIFRINPWLASYILRLLAMSRESVQDLHVSTSDISTPDIEISVTEGMDSKTLHETVKQSTQESKEMKQTTENKIDTDQRSELNTVKHVVNAVKDKRKGMTDDVPVYHKAADDSRQACHITSVPQVTRPYSYNEFGHVDTKIQSTLTPQKIQNSCKITDTELHKKVGGLEDVVKKHKIIQEQLHSSCRCDDDSCECDMKTPPFASVISDMSVDEYKKFKFPEIFSNYSEKCSERISHLTQKIEQIRGERKKLIESSGSCSSSASRSSASSNISEFDSTKYLSPPDMSVVMPHLPSKGKGPFRVEVSDQEAGVDVPCICDAGNQQQMFQNNELPNCTSFLKPSDGNENGVQQQQHSRRNHTHIRPPPCLWRYKLQRAVNVEPIKELSTVTEGATIQSSCSSPCNTEQAKIDIGENSKNSEGTEILGDDDIPDVMTDMLRRGLITSPLAWTKVVQQSDDETSVSDVSFSGFSHDSESKKFTASSLQHEHEKFKHDVLESYVGKGTESPESFKDRQSIAVKKMGFSQQVAETFAKLGKNPSRTDMTNAFKNLGLKWKARGRDQNVNPVISKEGLDPASEEFRQQVLESFVGLGLDSSPEDLQAAFQRLGLDCPDGYLCRSDVCESKHTHRASFTPESARRVRSNIQCYGAASPMSGTVLPLEPPSDPASCDGSLSP